MKKCVRKEGKLSFAELKRWQLLLNEPFNNFHFSLMGIIHFFLTLCMKIIFFPSLMKQIFYFSSFKVFLFRRYSTMRGIIIIMRVTYTWQDPLTSLRKIPPFPIHVIEFTGFIWRELSSSVLVEAKKELWQLIFIENEVSFENEWRISLCSLIKVFSFFFGWGRGKRSTESFAWWRLILFKAKRSSLGW